MITKTRALAAVLAALAALALVAPGPATADLLTFFNGFETDLSGFDAFSPVPDFVTRVPSGTHGIASRTGSYHAEAAQSALDCPGPEDPPLLIPCGGQSAATNWGGFSDVPGCVDPLCAATGSFPPDGYTTSLHIYLDVGGEFVNDTRFDYTSAINRPDGEYRRDFAFNGGFYNDSDVTGEGHRFVVSTSNDYGRGDAFHAGATPKDPARGPFTITETGWYTFRHRFYDSGGGVLAVELSIIDSLGSTVHSWTLSDPTDVIGDTVGGNAWGWLASQEFPFLAIDNALKGRALLNFDFSGTQYQDNFRDVRRASDINAGTDLAGGGHPSLNMTGSSNPFPKGDAWITVYDEDPSTSSPTSFVGSIRLSADVLVHKFDNLKGAGVLALFNEGAGQKGLALILYGSRDNLGLATLDEAGTRVHVDSVLLGSAIKLDIWYRVTMKVAVSGDDLTVKGKVFKHASDSDPDSALGAQVGDTLSFTGSLSALGLAGSGQIGVVGFAKRAKVSSSVTNFSADQ